MSHDFKKYLKKYLILIDTCSMMHPLYPQFMQKYEKDVMESGALIRMTESNQKELLKHFQEGRNLDSYEDPDRRKKIETASQEAYRGLQTNVRFAKMISVLGSEESPLFADAGIYTYISAAYVSRNVLLITQDVKLTYDVLKLRERISIDSYFRLECLHLSSSDGSLLSEYSPETLAEAKRKADEEKAEKEAARKKAKK